MGTDEKTIKTLNDITINDMLLNIFTNTTIKKKKKRYNFLLHKNIWCRSFW